MAEREVKIKVSLFEDGNNDKVLANVERRFQRLANDAVVQNFKKTKQALNDSGLNDTVVKNVNRATLRDFQTVNLAKEKLTQQRLLAERRLIQQQSQFEIREERLKANQVLAIRRQAFRESQASNGGGGHGGFGGGAGGDFFSGLLGGSRFGGFGLGAAGVAAGAVLATVGALQQLASALYQIGQASLEVGARYEKVVNALTASVGSASKARIELAEMDEVARNTVGLRLETAEQGYQRLRVLGFEANRAQRIIKELGEEKFLSGATDENVEKVIFNFTQIASGGQKIGQELREILTQLPSLKNAFFDAFGTLSGQKIQAQLENLGTNVFFDKLLDSLAKQKAGVGGVEDAYGKFKDELIVVGRELSLPVIPEITKDLKSLASFLKENQDTWKSWGQNIKTVYQDVSSFLKLIGSGLDAINQKLKQQEGESDIGRLLRLGPRLSNDAGQLSPLNDYLAEQRKGATSELDAWGFAIEEAQKLEDERLLLEKQREIALGKAKGVNEDYVDSLKSYYSRLEVLASSKLILTNQDELEQLQKVSSIRKAGLTAELAAQKNYFARSIALADGDKEKVEDLTLEKNKALRKLNDDLFKNEIETQKRINEVNRQILEQRRQDTIAFKQLQIREIQQLVSRDSFNFEREISQGLNTDANFDKLKNATRSSFEIIANITRESYTLQLQDQRLTAEQRVNIEKQMGLDLADLAEQNRQKQLQISDNQYKEQVQLLETYSQRVRDLYAGQATLYQSIGQFFNVSAFSGGSSQALRNSVYGELDKLDTELLKAETRKNSLSRSRADFLKSKGVGEFATQDEFSSKLSAIDIQALTKNDEEYQKVSKAYTDLLVTQDKLKSAISGVTDEVLSIAQAMAKGTIGIEGFDLANRKLLESTQKLEQAGLQSEISLVEQLIELARKEKDQKGLLELNHRLSLLTSKSQNLTIEQSAQSLKQYQESLGGMRDQLANLQKGDTEAWLGFLYEVEKSDIQKQIGQLKDFALIQKEINEKGIFKQLDTDLLVLGGLNDRIKSVNETIADFRLGIADSFLNPIESLFDSINTKLEKLPVGIRELASAFNNLFRDIIKQFANKFILRLFGFDNATIGGNGKGGNILSSIFGGGSGGGGGSFPAILGGGVFGSSGTTPPFVSNFAGGTTGNFNFSNLIGGGNFSTTGGGSGLSSRFPGIFGNIGGSGSSAIGGSSSIPKAGIGALSQGGGLFGGKGTGAFLKGIAPLLGLQLGTLLGGSSRGGQILGGLGGLLGGGIATGAISGSTPVIGGAVNALSGVLGAVGAAAVFAAPLLVGALLLKRNAARRRDEKTRNDLMVDTLSKLGDIKKEMEAAKSGINIDGLLDETKTISANYFTEANKLKDKKTRGIAIKDGNERVGIVPPNSAFPAAMTNQIYGLADSARAKEEMRAIAGLRNQQVLPEFATGGMVKSKRGGHLAVVGEGGFDEFILTTDPKHKSRTLGLMSAFIEKMNFSVPKFEMGGIAPIGSFSIPSAQNATTVSNAPINISIAIDADVDAGGIVVKGIKTSEDAKREVKVTIENYAAEDKLKLTRRK